MTDKNNEKQPSKSEEDRIDRERDRSKRPWYKRLTGSSKKEFILDEAEIQESALVRGVREGGRLLRLRDAKEASKKEKILDLAEVQESALLEGIEEGVRQRKEKDRLAREKKKRKQ